MRIGSRPRIKRVAIYSLAFFLPLLLFGAVCFFTKTAPFGDNTLALVDARGQYLDFFAYFKNAPQNGDNLLYTFSKSMGGNMAGFAAYYLLSPLNLLLFLFPNATLPVALTVIIGLKIALSGLTFNLCINRVPVNSNRGKPFWVSLLFSSCYALMGYSAAFFHNLMWLDGVILLPLIVWGLFRLTERKRPELYILSLAAALIINYYIGFMLCIFSVLFFLFLLAGGQSQNQSPEREGFDPFDLAKPQTAVWRSLLRFALSSLLAAGLAAAVLVPAFCSLSGGKAGFNPNSLSFTANFAPLDFFSRFFTGAFSADLIPDGTPNVFVGSVPLALCALFFFNRKIPARERCAAGGVLLVLFFSMLITAPNLAWHGFNHPVWFLYRYSFVFSFMLIFLAARCWQCREGVRPVHVCLALLMITGLAAAALLGKYKYIRTVWVVTDVLLAAGFCVFPILKRKNKITRGITQSGIAAACLAQTALLCVNFGIGLKSLQNWDYIKQSDYQAFVEEVQPAADAARPKNGEIYRMEQNFHRTNNDPMQFSFPGLSHYSSTEPWAVLNFEKSMGLNQNYVWTHYGRGSTTGVDVLLGVRYLLSRGAEKKPYMLAETVNGIKLYENTLALPLAFAANAGIRKIALSGTDAFFNLNAIFAAAAGDSGEIYTVLTPELELQNLTKDGATYEKQQPGASAYLVYTLTAADNSPVYALLDGKAYQSADIYVNETRVGTSLARDAANVVHLGRFAAGEIFTVKIAVRDKLELSAVKFCREDEAILEQYADRLKTGGASLKKLSSSHLKGSVTVPAGREAILFTIPYDKGWTVLLDGERRTCEPVLGALMSVSAEPGQHTLELNYTPPGLKAGLIISLLALVAAVTWQVLRKTRGKNNRCENAAGVVF